MGNKVDQIPPEFSTKYSTTLDIIPNDGSKTRSEYGDVYVNEETGEFIFAKKNEKIQIDPKSYQLGIHDEGQTINFSSRGGGARLNGSKLIYVYSSPEVTYRLRTFWNNKSSLKLGVSLTKNQNLLNYKIVQWGYTQLILSFILGFVLAMILASFLAELGLLIGFLVGVFGSFRYFENKTKDALFDLHTQYGIIPEHPKMRQLSNQTTSNITPN